MTEAAELTIEILRGIRNDLAESNRRSDTRFDAMERHQSDLAERLDATQRRLVDAEIRLATELTSLASAVVGVRDLLRERLDDRAKLAEHEERIGALERRSRPRGTRAR